MAKNPYEVDGNVLYSRYYANKAPATTTQQSPASLSDLYSQIMNRQKFSYDVGSDPLYQQYKDRYLQQGQTAMRDTMGQAAALTGGYGSSYAQGVGQQAYDKYVQGLNDKIPELYSAAYSRYQDEGNNLMQQYALAKDKEDTEYNRAQDAYQRLYTMISSTGYEPTDEELKAAGMTREIANRLRSIALMKNPDLGGINAKGMVVNSLVAAPVAETPVYTGSTQTKKPDPPSQMQVTRIAHSDSTATPDGVSSWLQDAYGMSKKDADKMAEIAFRHLEK